MVAKCVLGSAVSTIVVLVVSQAVLGGDYDPGYVWERQSDWTQRPDGNHGTTNGNPDGDSVGNPTWGYEYYLSLPDDSNLDSAVPWYTLPSSGMMEWDKSWYGGGSGRWVYDNDMPPVTGPEVLTHVNTDTGDGALFADVPMVRWTNPTGEDIHVSLITRHDFGVRWGGENGTAADVDVDVVIAHIDVSEANAMTVLYGYTIDKLTKNNHAETRPLPSMYLSNVPIGAGDQILFSVRAQEHRGSTWNPRWVSLYDDVTITVVPESGPPSGTGATVFLSPVTAVGGGATLANPELTVQLGETVRMGVWISASEGMDVDRMALDLEETAGILDANVLTLAEAVGYPRWHNVVDANLNVSDQRLFRDSSSAGGMAGAYGLTGVALFRTLDANFDPGAGDGNGAFLYAIIEFTATALGDTDLYLTVGGETIAYDSGDPGADTAIHFGLGDDPVWRTIAGAISALPDATIHVVPEPVTVTLLCLGAAVVLRRRRKHRFC